MVLTSGKTGIGRSEPTHGMLLEGLNSRQCFVRSCAQVPRRVFDLKGSTKIALSVSLLPIPLCCFREDKRFLCHMAVLLPSMLMLMLLLTHALAVRTQTA
jgi:hypothetical protein